MNLLMKNYADHGVVVVRGGAAKALLAAAALLLLGGSTVALVGTAIADSNFLARRRAGQADTFLAETFLQEEEAPFLALVLRELLN